MPLTHARAAIELGSVPPALSGDAVQLGQGSVRHLRQRPSPRAFRHPALFLRLRIDGAAAQKQAANLGRWFGWGRWAPMGFDPRDHGDGQGTLEPWVRSLLSQSGVTLEGPIWLHCFPSMWGYGFKPVSFWFCHHTNGSLRAVLAEVNNTFGERHVYLLADPHHQTLLQGQELRAQKVFHVSPFCEVRGDYTFRFIVRADRTIARIDLHDETGPFLITSLSGTLCPATPHGIRRAVLRHPTFSLGVIAHIHWHALRLWRMGVPFHRKPPPPPDLVSRGHP